jgi:ribosomal-protein-serine acetyltransferase
MLAILLEDRVARVCGLHRRVRPNALELGYWVYHAFTRKGLATRVARLLTTAAFSVPGVESVEIHHD